VGQFEFSLNRKRAIVTMGDTTANLQRVLIGVGGSARHWIWSFRGLDLLWDCRTTLDDGSPMCICSNTDASATQLALFVAPPPDASPLPAAVLTIFPDGHQDAMFDHILLSALVIVRGLAAPL